jgi:hypothetical protein
LQLISISLGSTPPCSRSWHLYFLVYAVFPKPTHPEYGALDGAYVSLFVNEPVRSAAELAAGALIEQEGWEIETCWPHSRQALRTMTFHWRSKMESATGGGSESYAPTGRGLGLGLTDELSPSGFRHVPPFSRHGIQGAPRPGGCMRWLGCTSVQFQLMGNRLLSPDG